MRKAMTCIWLAAAVMALFAAATPAYAEFESTNKASDKGTGSTLETVFEAGGAVVACTDIEEGSKATWTNEKEGKEALKSPDVLLKVGSWGKCEVSKPIKGAVKVTGCELEVEQPKEQMKLTGKVVKTCTLEGPLGCTITASSTSNKQLKEIIIDVAGESGESTIFQPAVSNLVTEVNAACKLGGINGSKEGKVTGVWEAQQDRPAGTREYAISAPASIAASGTFMVKIKRIGGAAGTMPPGQIIFAQSATAQAGQFLANAGNLTTCKMLFNYLLNGMPCELAVMYDKTKGLGYLLCAVEGGANGMVRTARVVLGD